MEFLQNLFSPKNSVLIGKLEVASIESVVSSLLGLLSAMGMSNPPIGTAYSKKGVVVKKKGKNFVITLHQYNPPITFTWTGPFNEANLMQAIVKIIEENKKITAINYNKLANGQNIYQFAIA